MERWEMVVNCGEIEGFCVGNSPYPFLQREICRIIIYDIVSFSNSVEWGIMKHKKIPSYLGGFVRISYPI